jgi:hypothetical protein
MTKTHSHELARYVMLYYKMIVIVVLGQQRLAVQYTWRRESFLAAQYGLFNICTLRG